MKKLFFLIMIYCSTTQASMKLISPAFSHNELIPRQYTCDGENISPALTWSNAPEHTQSFALIMDDSSSVKTSADRPSTAVGKPSAKPWVHWIVFNIPSTITHIKEDQGNLSEEAPFTYGATDFNGAQKWGGPCPPNGIHRYQFTLYALDTMLDISAGATKEELLDAMQGHILEKTTLIGIYQRNR